MTNQELMFKFIKYINDEGLITKFLINIFNYKELSDHNYIFRIASESYYIVMDLFDNISENRFNRYMFDFSKGKKVIEYNCPANIFVTHIKIFNVKKDDNNLVKLAYLFKLKKCRMIGFAKTFLDDQFVKILEQFI